MQQSPSAAASSAARRPLPAPSVARTQRHAVSQWYDRRTEHTAARSDRRQTQQRRHGEAYPLKTWHNAVKRALLELACTSGDFAPPRRRFGGPALPPPGLPSAAPRLERVRSHRLLDLGCGRGGDLAKWWQLPAIRSVTAVDRSVASLAEAARRWQVFVRRGAPGGVARTAPLPVDFVPVATLGDEPWSPPLPPVVSEGGVSEGVGSEGVGSEGVGSEGVYSWVSCMFALQYFFGSETELRQLIGTVARLLEPGGVFCGCLPDARALVAMLRRPVTARPLALTLVAPAATLAEVGGDRGAPDSVEAFGQAYQMAVRDTVVAAVEDAAAAGDDDEATDQPPVEYLAWPSLLATVCADAGLRPVLRTQLTGSQLQGMVRLPAPPPRVPPPPSGGEQWSLYPPRAAAVPVVATDPWTLLALEPRLASLEWNEISSLYSVFYFAKVAVDDSGVDAHH
jgi:SAM-dependent methyltransferase